MTADTPRPDSSVPPTTAGRSPVVKTILYGAVIVATVAGVYFATRGNDAPTPMAGGHNHGASGASGAPAQPVMLTDVQARRIGVTYDVADLRPLEREIRTVGQVTFDETRLSAVSPKIDGWVERLYVNATGQSVRAGQPLLTIYSPMLVQAQEELLLAKRLQGNLAEATTATQGNAASLLESARRRLSYWDVPESDVAEIERSGVVRKTLTLYAPTSGAVLEKNVVVGQRIMAGEVLYRVADLRDVWVEGEVFEQDLADVHVGLTVHADFAALPGEHRMGRILFMNPTISPETRTARVRVVFPNGDGRLMPGMYATLRIVGTARPQVLTVPRDAVLSTGERHVVFVRDPSGALVPREVAVGTSSDERIEILRGVSAGDTVVASATFLVDAESNLGKALGGMGNMPGMDMQTPPVPLPMRETRGGASPAGGARTPPAADSQHKDHDMSGMEHMDHDMSGMDMKGMEMKGTDRKGTTIKPVPKPAGKSLRAGRQG
jgi:Cu(I)/Ag(I) efflux system membrane fusion protein